MTTNEMLAKLKSMANTAGERIFERVKMAASVLADHVWIDSEFSGDDEKARSVVESDYFPELSAAFGLADLLTLYREFPDAADWKKHKYNLNRLWAEHEEREAEKNKRPPVQRTPRPKAVDVKERDEKIQELTKSVGDFRHQLEVVKTESKSEIETLRAENIELREENAQLKGENKALNRLIEQMRSDRPVMVSR